MVCQSCIKKKGVQNILSLKQLSWDENLVLWAYWKYFNTSILERELFGI